MRFLLFPPRWPVIVLCSTVQMNPVLALMGPLQPPYSVFVTQMKPNPTNTKTQTNRNEKMHATRLLFRPPLSKSSLSPPPAPSVDIVQPIDDVEEGEDCGEDYPRPLVDGVDVGQVGDVDLELGGPPP